MGRLGRLPMPWVTSSAATATMPSATAMGTLISTRERTQANSRSMAMTASVRHFGKIACLGGGEPARLPDHLRQVDQLGEDDKHSAHRDRGLGPGDGNPGQADQVVGGEHLQHAIASPAKEGEKADYQDFGEEDEGEPPSRRHAVHQAGETDVGALQRSQRRAVEGEPCEHHRGHFVIPRQRQTDGAEEHACRYLGGERDHQHDDYPSEQELEPGTQSRHGFPRLCPTYLPSAIARAITSFAAGTSLAYSSYTALEAAMKASLLALLTWMPAVFILASSSSSSFAALS